MRICISAIYLRHCISVISISCLRQRLSSDWCRRRPHRAAFRQAAFSVDAVLGASLGRLALAVLLNRRIRSSTPKCSAIGFDPIPKQPRKTHWYSAIGFNPAIGLTFSFQLVHRRYPRKSSVCVVLDVLLLRRHYSERPNSARRRSGQIDNILIGRRLLSSGAFYLSARVDDISSTALSLCSAGIDNTSLSTGRWV